MPVTAKNAACDALRLMGRMNAFGVVDENKESKYFSAAVSYLNLVCADICRAAGGALALPLADLGDLLPIPDDSAHRVAPIGLAMYFSILDRDSELYNFFSTVYYGSLLPSVQADETPLTDFYGVAQDPDFFG